MPRWPGWTEAGRFWDKVNKNGPLILGHEELGPCWLWTGAKTSDGRGNFWVVRDGNNKTLQSHHWSLNDAGIEIPNGLVPDHLCHTFDETCNAGQKCVHRRCVNVLHLEMVTQKENALRGRSFSAENARKTHCPYGHEYTVENTIILKYDRGRWCRLCQREDGRKRRQAKREKAALV